VYRKQNPKVIPGSTGARIVPTAGGSVQYSHAPHATGHASSSSGPTVCRQNRIQRQQTGRSELRKQSPDL